VPALPHPQTGQRAFPPAAAGECPPRPADAQLAAADGSGGTPGGAAPAAGRRSAGRSVGAAAHGSGAVRVACRRGRRAGDAGRVGARPWRLGLGAPTDASRSARPDRGAPGDVEALHDQGSRRLSGSAGP
jgi:hypothetical protein